MGTTILEDKELATAEAIRIANELSIMTRQLRWSGSPATYTMFSIYNKWYTGQYGEGIRRSMSMNCRPCIDKVMNFFLKLPVTS